jgi:hypothetical protein
MKTNFAFHLVLLVCMMSISKIGLAQTSVSSPGVNCVQPTAYGDGTHDDTTALQNALNAAGTTGQAVCLQPGRYKYTSNLIVPTRVSVHGLSGSFNFGVEMDPTGNAAFVLDGSTMPGAFAIRQTFSNLTFQLQNTTAANGIYINGAYHLTLDHVAIYNGQKASVSALSISNVTLIECNFCVVWGNQSSPSGTGVAVSANGAAIKFSTLNVEGFSTGLITTGSGNLTLIDPWFEANMLGYSHGISGGSVQIIGGMVSVFDLGVGVKIIGDHLLMQGTNFSLGVGSYGFSATSAVYQDVKILGLPQVSLANMFHATDNIAELTLDPAPVIPISKIRFAKTVSSGVPTNILSLNQYVNFARFRLVLTAFGGNGFQTKQYDFGITGNTIVGNTPADPQVTSLSTFQNANWNLSLGTLTLTPSGNSVVVGITATMSGALGSGHAPTIIGELEVVNYYDPSGHSGFINVTP